MPRVVVMIPTYNEAANVRQLLPEILALGPEYEVLVVDDQSPDGTGDAVRELASALGRVTLLSRDGPRGRGLAGRDGFLKALDMEAEVVVEMDADLSHRPAHIPELVAATAEADVVIGSRMVPGGREEGRSAARRLITVFANLYIRTLLSVPVRDATSGFRAFKRHALSAIPLRQMLSRGPSIVQEVLYACCLSGFRVKEIPIVFVDRVAGRSTFTLRVMRESLLAVLAIRRRRSELVARGSVKLESP